MAYSEINGRKSFKYDAPRPRLLRMFWLDQNEDDQPLSGKLLSFTTYSAYNFKKLPKMLYDSLNEDLEAYRVMIAVSSRDYIALSYSWGNSPERYPLYVTTIHNKLDDSNERRDLPDKQRVIMDQDTDRNGYLWIGANLRDFLLEFRRKGDNRFLWIDALCIDQSSSEDKDFQLPMMRYYYDRAIEVNVWLGTANSLEMGALRILPRIAEKLCQEIDSEEEIEDTGKLSVLEDTANSNESVQQNQVITDSEQSLSSDDFQNQMPKSEVIEGDHDECNEWKDVNVLEENLNQADRARARVRSQNQEHSEEARHQVVREKIPENEARKTGKELSIERTLEYLGLPPAEHGVWIALASILTRSWWNRLWTLQEVVMAKTKSWRDPTRWKPGDILIAPVKVACGEVTIPYKVFDDLLTGLSKHGFKTWLIAKSGLPINRQLYGLDAIYEIRICRESIYTDRMWAVSPGVVLVATRRREATVPADKVHGMMAMFDQYTIEDMAVSVKMRTQEVFVRFARYYIRNEPQECLLNHVATCDRLEGLPSWCPNFASPPETIPIGTRWLGHHKLTEFQDSQIVHAGSIRIEDSDNWSVRNCVKWSRPVSKSWLAGMKPVRNMIVGRDTRKGMYDTSNPRQISIVKGTDFLQASGAALDTVIEYVECNSAMDPNTSLDANDVTSQTLEWDQRCLSLATKALHCAGKTANEILNIYSRTVTTNRVRMDVSDDDQLVIDHKDTLDFAAAYQDWKKYLQAKSTAGSEPNGLKLQKAKQFADVLGAMSRRRRFFVTKSGRIGFGPSNLQVGDTLVVIFFCPTLYLIRGKPMTENWEFVGETYVHGLMYDEALELVDKDHVKETKWVFE
jgi:hypothetical protein